jgi:hypothetical protein
MRLPLIIGRLNKRTNVGISIGFGDPPTLSIINVVKKINQENKRYTHAINSLKC